MIELDIEYLTDCAIEKEWIEKVTIKTLECLNEDNVHLGITICDNKKIQELNKKYRGKDTATNVLSFPIRSDLKDKGLELGDIFLSYQTALKEAVDEAVKIEYKIVRLIVHSILHLCGIHHDTKSSEKKMYKLMDGIIDKIEKTQLIFGKKGF